MRVAENHQRGRIRPAIRLHRVGVPAVLLLLTIAFYWRLVLTDQYTWLESPDIAQQVLPWFQYQAGEWHQGRFPMWDPHHGTGQPLIGQAQPGAAYPLNWILFSLPLKEGWIRQAYLHWYFVLTRWLAALFCYWLCRELGRSRTAATLAGVLFAFGGYIGFTDWPQMVNGAVWAPLVLLFAIRAWRGRYPYGSAAIGGMFLGVSWLSGHHQIPIFVSLVMVGLWAWQATRGFRLRWDQAKAASLFFGFAGLTGSLQVLPAIEYGRRALRWVSSAEPVGWNQAVPYRVHTSFSLQASDLLGLVFSGVCQHAELVMGTLGMALALAALMAGMRSPLVRLMALIGAAGLALALGGSSVVHGVLYAVIPLVEKARVPLAAIFILHLSVSVLSAWGLDHLCIRGRTRHLARLAGFLAAAGALLWAALAALWIFTNRTGGDQLGFPALILLSAAALLWARGKRLVSPTAAGAACVVLVLMEVGSVRGPLFPHRLDDGRNQYLNKMSQLSDVVRFVKAAKWPVRVDVDARAIPFNLGDWYGFDVLSSNVPSLLANFVVLGPERERVHQLLGVSYHIGPAPRWRGQEVVFEGADGMNVYHNAGAFRRVWAVHEVVRLDRREQIGPTLDDPAFDLHRRAFVVREPPPVLESAKGSDMVRLVLREPHLVRIEVEMGSKGMVVLSDAFFPGWQARLDGVRVPIYEVYGGLRGVVTPAGRHVIEMRYRPASVFLGGVLTALGVIGACGLAVAGWRRRTRA